MGVNLYDIAGVKPIFSVRAHVISSIFQHVLQCRFIVVFLSFDHGVSNLGIVNRFGNIGGFESVLGGLGVVKTPNDILQFLWPVIGIFHSHDLLQPFLNQPDTIGGTEKKSNIYLLTCAY